MRERATASLALTVSLALMALLRPTAAGAQDASSGSIVGTVRDSAGAVLPGATVEAASPALIEKVRTVPTDGEGRHRIVDLRPGSYRGSQASAARIEAIKDRLIFDAR